MTDLPTDRPLQYKFYISSDDFTPVTMKNGVFWDVTPRGSYKSRCFGGINDSIITVATIGELGKNLAVTSK
jgi:hypothetical protein